MHGWEWRGLRSCLTTFVILATAFFGSKARADIGVVIADPTTIGYSSYTQAGHSLVYLSGVCPISPIQARLCEPGEQGSIVTTYPHFREAQPYAWNIAPLSIYLQGLPDPETRLLYASPNVKDALQKEARHHFLQPVCGAGDCPDVQHSYWRDLVAATADRDVFVYAVRTTRAQDQVIVDWLNTDPNVNHYHGMTNNCAVFTRTLVNMIFPHSVHRDFLNDLGMMGPKAAARSFTHWAVKHTELGFYSLHFAQQPGEIPRSGLARSGTETAIHTKKYLIPAALIGDHEVAGSFFVAYFLTGRFGLYKEYLHHSRPSFATSEQATDTPQASPDMVQPVSLMNPPAPAMTLAKVPDATSEQALLTRYQAFAAAEEIPQGKKGKMPIEFAKAQVTVDSDGNPWIEIEANNLTRRVGITSANVLAPGSDPELAFEFMLGRVECMIHAKNHGREDPSALQDDWLLLQQAYDRLQPAQPAGGLSVIAARR